MFKLTMHPNLQTTILPTGYAPARLCDAIQRWTRIDADLWLNEYTRRAVVVRIGGRVWTI